MDKPKRKRQIVKYVEKNDRGGFGVSTQEIADALDISLVWAGRLASKAEGVKKVSRSKWGVKRWSC